ncbi:MAG TPA: BadF/BadG/BcrA/BcrD ATPase family protein, partial [Rariglobus sp.]
MESPLFAGIDVGGTTTRIALADNSGRVLGRGRAPGAGFTEVPAEESSRRLALAWRDACTEAGHDFSRPVTALFAGFGSIAAPRDAAIAQRCLRLAGIKARHL